MVFPDHDEDNLFADTRMSFGDHIEDLRNHLWRAIYGFGICLLLCFPIGKYVVGIIAQPVTEQLQAFYDRRFKEVMENLAKEEQEIQKKNAEQGILPSFQVKLLVDDKLRKQLDPNAPPREPTWAEVDMQFSNPLRVVGALRNAQERIGKRPALTTLSIQEAFIVYFKVCLVTAFVMSSPWVFYQVWAFVAAGLYPHEKRPVHVYLPFSLGLFLGGVALCQFLVLPKAIEVMLKFNDWLGLEPDLRLNEWLSFAIIMPLIFGLSFQTPLVMMALFKVGIVDIETMTTKRRYAWFILAAFTAIVTPTPDALTMMFLWVPLIGLYELGIILCRLSPRPVFDLDVPDSEEMIEV